MVSVRVADQTSRVEIEDPGLAEGEIAICDQELCTRLLVVVAVRVARCPSVPQARSRCIAEIVSTSKVVAPNSGDKPVRAELCKIGAILLHVRHQCLLARKVEIVTQG